MHRASSGSSTSPVALVLCAVLALLAAVSVAGGTSSHAYAALLVAAGEKAVVANTDGDPIRVREGAGTDFAQIAKAYEGQTVSILEGPVSDTQGIRWFKVQAPGGTGWMMAEFIAGNNTPSVAPKVKLTGSALVANTDGDKLRVRSSPNSGGKVLTLLDPGTAVAVQEGPVPDSAGVMWYRIAARDITGWVMAMYLAQASAAPAAAKQQAPQAEPAVAVKRAAAPASASKPAAAEKPQAPANTSARSAGSAGSSTQAQYRQWIEEARTVYPYTQTTDKMWSVMMCESGGNPRASGGGGRWLGLFQYVPTTWTGSWNPYRGESIWDARAQIFATAKAWSIGMQGHWSCYYYTAGR